MEVRIVKKRFPFGSYWIAYVDNKPRAAFNSFQEALSRGSKAADRMQS